MPFQLMPRRLNKDQSPLTEILYPGKRLETWAHLALSESPFCCLSVPSRTSHSTAAAEI